jgi:hypothetical protein
MVERYSPSVVSRLSRNHEASVAHCSASSISSVTSSSHETWPAPTRRNRARATTLAAPRRCARYVLRRLMIDRTTIAAIAAELGVSWHTVSSIAMRATAALIATAGPDRLTASVGLLADELMHPTNVDRAEVTRGHLQNCNE